MSQHPTLKIKQFKTCKTVLKRLERIKKLLEEGKWKEGDEVFGLPKVKIKVEELKKKKDKKEEKIVEQTPEMTEEQKKEHKKKMKEMMKEKK